MTQPSLKFPLKWHGKLVTASEIGDVTDVVFGIFSSLALADGMIESSALSSRGAYRSWSLSATIPEHEVLKLLFDRLRTVPGVKMII